MDSCLVSRLERFLTLTKHEKEFVAYMEREERTMRRKECLLEIGADADCVYILKFGWMIARSAEHNGVSSLVRIYLPGEIAGLAEIGRGEALYSLSMLTDGCVCPFPRKAIAEMFTEAPRLAALLTSLSSLDQLELRERVRALARMTAEERLSFFLLTLQDRLAVANSRHSRRFHLPLTNAELGDHLGLTDIYVSRTMKKLVANGRIDYSDRHVTIKDRDTWAAEIGHKDIYENIDTSWYPEPAYQPAH